MASVFDRAVRDGLKRRVGQLHPDTQRKWGLMDAAAMQVHVIAGMKMALGTLRVEPKKSLLGNAVVRWMVIHSPIPWPKGTPTAKELINLPSVDFVAEQEELVHLINSASARGQTDGWPAHPMFGQMSERDWGVLIWRHLDHHLRQFGL